MIGAEASRLNYVNRMKLPAAAEEGRRATGEGGVAESRYKDAASLAVAAASLSRRPAADAFSAFPLPSPGGFFFFGLESSSAPLTKRLFSVSSSSRAAAVASRVRGAYAVLR